MTRDQRSRMAFLQTLVGIFIATLALLPASAAPALASSVPVSYDALTNTITVGDMYIDPGQLANPAIAPKTDITLGEVAAALVNPLYLTNSGAEWTLSANLHVLQTARLLVQSPEVTILRLAVPATPGCGDTPSASCSVLFTTGGHIRILNTAVTSWNSITSTVDTNYVDGRSYLLALEGGTLDIVGSNVSYLGWNAGEGSGISYRKRATDSDETTGATGSIQNSTIHHNYFGMYSYAAYRVQITGSTFRDQIYYGIDPHTGSVEFTVANNTVHNNGKHGIIFSRDCLRNVIRDNIVYDNVNHGIMLDRGSNQNTISNNLVYGNDDAIAIFQSANNIIENNTLRNNNRGVRINATYDQNDEYDGISSGNTVRNNTISDSSQYGIYLYERADGNTISGNSVKGSKDAGIYIKSFGATVTNNEVRDNGRGLALIGGSLTPIPGGGPTPVPALGLPGRNTVITNNDIVNNGGTGIQLVDAVSNRIGATVPGFSSALGNRILENGSYGITLNGTSTDNTIAANTINANVRDGVLVKGNATIRNRISRNLITANGDLGVNIDPVSPSFLTPPTVIGPVGNVISGVSAPNARIEIYRDPGGEGHIYKGIATADGSGNWSFTLPSGDTPAQGNLTALAIDANGNTSEYGERTSGGGIVRYAINSTSRGMPTVYITGSGASITLPEVAAELKIISPTVDLLQDQGNGVWQANISLFVSRGVTLTLTAPVTWIKLRSQVGDIGLADDAPVYNYRSFTTLTTYDGTIIMDGVKVTSWDPQANTYDLNVKDGRSYVLAKYSGNLTIRRSQLSYLGSADGESYGISWRDVNDGDNPATLLTRVTGSVTDSEFSYNYYGIYTFQARDMIFRNNTFHNNIGYGFDPHDFSYGFIVEDNKSYENGNHGFIISRGCNNFVIRRNSSYNNRHTVTDADRAAHGFMLDPGSPTSADPQAPSVNNLIEDNVAYGNDGYGMRIIGSNTNIIRNNTFYGNEKGMTIEDHSTGNIVSGNAIRDNTSHGIYIFATAGGNTIQDNSVLRNGGNGIYIRASNNQILRNMVRDNGGTTGAGINVTSDTDDTAASNTINDNIVTGNGVEGIELKTVPDTQILRNTVMGNGSHGIYLAAGTTGTQIASNWISVNLGQGIRTNDAATTRNVWTENLVFDNNQGGIVTTGGSQSGVTAPTIATQTSKPTECRIAGVAQPGATVELFSDDNGQARAFEGRTTANSTGVYAFTAPRACWSERANAVAILNNTASGMTNMAQIAAGSNRIYLPVVQQTRGT